MTIREATKDDLETLVEFNQQMAVETEGRHLDTATLRSGTSALLNAPQFGFYMVAENQGDVSGQLMITYEWSDWRNGVFWWIQSVYVRPQHRGKGVYRTMHEHVLHLARERNACGVRLYVDKSNRIAQKVYEKCGMTPSHYDLFEVDFVLH